MLERNGTAYFAVGLGAELQPVSGSKLVWRATGRSDGADGWRRLVGCSRELQIVCLVYLLRS